MVEWIKVGTNVVVGGALGAGDQLIQNADDKREVERAEKLPILSQYGTYYNYGIPILGILAAAFGFLRGDWATRVITGGSVLAGRKVTRQVTKKEGSSPWVGWRRNRELEARRRLEAATAGAGARAGAGVGLEF